MYFFVINVHFSKSTDSHYQFLILFSLIITILIYIMIYAVQFNEYIALRLIVFTVFF